MYLSLLYCYLVRFTKLVDLSANGAGFPTSNEPNLVNRASNLASLTKTGVAIQCADKFVQSTELIQVNIIHESYELILRNSYAKLRNDFFILLNGVLIYTKLSERCPLDRVQQKYSFGCCHVVCS